MTEDQLLEAISALQHEAWEKWSKHVSKEVKPERLERWKEYWVPYEQLSDKVKEYDREFAREVMKLVKPHLKLEKEKAKAAIEYPAVAAALEAYPAVAAILAADHGEWDKKASELDKMQQEMLALLRKGDEPSMKAANDLKPKIDALFKQLYEVKTMGASLSEAGKWSPDVSDMWDYAMNVEGLYHDLKGIKSKADAEAVADTVISEYNKAIGGMEERKFVGSSSEVADYFFEHKDEV